MVLHEMNALEAMTELEKAKNETTALKNAVKAMNKNGMDSAQVKIIKEMAENKQEYQNALENALKEIKVPSII